MYKIADLLFCQSRMDGRMHNGLFSKYFTKIILHNNYVIFIPNIQPLSKGFLPFCLISKRQEALGTRLTKYQNRETFIKSLCLFSFWQTFNPTSAYLSYPLCKNNFCNFCVLLIRAPLL